MNIEENVTTYHTQNGTTSKERTLVMQDLSSELFPIVDENGEVKGSMTRDEAHDGTMKLHPVVHLHVFNSKGELYLQHRSKLQRRFKMNNIHKLFHETLKSAVPFFLMYIKTRIRK
jgi:hypothetical protein